MFKGIVGCIAVFFLFIPLADLFALDTLKIIKGKETYVVDGVYMEVLEDTSQKWTIKDVTSSPVVGLFKEKGKAFLHNQNVDPAFWVRFYLKNESADYSKWLLEIVDPHINYVEIYMQDSSGNLIKNQTGNYLPFLQRGYHHKNFVYDIDVPSGHSKVKTFYVRMKSDNSFAFVYNIRSNRYFDKYALNEYYLLGMYYGMILIMALYNLLMYLSVRERPYILYVLYVLTGAMMSLLEDGTGFEYLWPSYPEVNKWIYIFTPLLFLFLFSLYAKSFLEVSRNAPRLNKIINVSLVLYFCYLLIDLFISPKPAVFVVFMIPFIIMYIAAIMIFIKGYRPARYFIVGYSFIILSFFLYLLRINGLLGPGDPLTVYAFNYGLIFEIVIFSLAMSDRVRIIKMEKDAAQKKIIEHLVENEKLIDKAKKELESKVEERTQEINKKNKDITDSITYAKRLQEAILPDERFAEMILKEHFILYLPKAIVSGDFYWIHQKGNLSMFAAVDCTGHGVPGGFMSILAHNILNQVVKEMNLTRPGQILTEVNKKVNETLSTSNDFVDGEYGMDIALISLDRDKMEIQYAGAYNPLYIIREGELIETRADRISIGNTSNGIRNYFTNHVIKIEKGDMLYIFSDGYADQFGGPNRRKFMLGSFNKLLLEIHTLSMAGQKENLNKVFREWKDGYDQIDDILVMGVKI
jgi:two-component system, sensor histidine kinase LadS